MFISEALAKYGASLNHEGLIYKDGKVIEVKPMVAQNKVRFYATNSGALLGSYPATVDGVCYFIEAFWGWEQKNQKQ